MFFFHKMRFLRFSIPILIGFFLSIHQIFAGSFVDAGTKSPVVLEGYFDSRLQYMFETSERVFFLFVSLIFRFPRQMCQPARSLCNRSELCICTFLALEKMSKRLFCVTVSSSKVYLSVKGRKEGKAKRRSH